MSHAITARPAPRVDSAAAGALIVALSAVAFSTAGLFTRVVAADLATLLFWRGLFGGMLIAGFVLWQQRGGAWAALRAIGRPGLLAAACSTVATVCFIGALRATTVADVTVIYATAPFLAATIAWAWLGERPNRATLAGSVLALVGVVVMCGGALSGSGVFGDVLALAMSGLMALMMVIIRRNRHVSMLPAAALSAFACALLVAPFASPGSADARELGMLALFGTTQFGLGLLLLTIGSRYIPAARTSLLANLELPFAPFWVWLVFGELPTGASWFGGGIVVLGVLVDLAPQVMRQRR